MSVRDDLIAARALIADPTQWAHLSKDRRNRGGKCLCAYDALCEATRTLPYPTSFRRARDAESALEANLPSTFKPRNGSGTLIPLAQFNDAPATTHADIMALFDRAIDAVREREGVL